MTDSRSQKIAWVTASFRGYLRLAFWMLLLCFVLTALNLVTQPVFKWQAAAFSAACGGGAVAAHHGRHALERFARQAALTRADYRHIDTYNRITVTVFAWLLRLGGPFFLGLVALDAGGVLQPPMGPTNRLIIGGTGGALLVVWAVLFRIQRQGHTR